MRISKRQFHYAELQSEEGLQTNVLKLAEYCGWIRFHPLPALKSDGQWRTCYIGEDGFLDLTLLRKGRLIVAELKSARGKTTPGQERWLAEWRQVPGAEVYVWRPTDWDAITMILA